MCGSVITPGQQARLRPDGPAMSLTLRERLLRGSNLMVTPVRECTRWVFSV